jgi:phasin
MMGLEAPKSPIEVRELSEFGVSYAKQSYERMKAVAEEATTTLESSYVNSSKGMSEYGLTVMEIARSNTSAAFDFYTELLSVKSLSELIELSTARARAQFDATVAQSRQLGALAQKVTTDSFEPLKQSFTKAFNRST